MKVEKMTMENEIYFANIDRIFGFKDFTNKKKPTIYDEIKNLKGIHLHHRLLFEFSIRNKRNIKYINLILSYYHRYKSQIDIFCTDIKNDKICWHTFKFQEIENDYGQFIYWISTIFYNLKSALENIEFISFNYYEHNSIYRHPLINEELFTLMNKIYNAQKKIAIATNETQLDIVIDENTTEFIGKNGFKYRLELDQTDDFLLNFIYRNDYPNFYCDQTEIYPKLESTKINENFMNKNISFKINLGMTNKDIKLIIDDLYNQISIIKDKHEKAIDKFQLPLKKTDKKIDDYFLKELKNEIYAKLLYAFDQNEIHSKKLIEINIENIKNENIFAERDLLYNSIPNKKDSIFNKYTFYTNLKRKISYNSNVETLRKDLSKLSTLINEKLYLQII